MNDADDTVRAPVRSMATPEPAQPDTEDTVIPVHAASGPIDPPAEDSVPRSQLFYTFRIGDSGESLALDVPSYVGRRPSAPRVSAGAVPRLVRVSSPRQEVSATHLEVRQLGASVIVTDLRSTNGSIVALPGNVPRKLRQGESVVVSPGTLVDIGDGNILQILAPPIPQQRPAQPAGRQP